MVDLRFTNRKMRDASGSAYEAQGIAVGEF
jgi:hypothetical protein